MLDSKHSTVVDRMRRFEAIATAVLIGPVVAATRDLLRDACTRLGEDPTVARSPS